MDEKINLSKQIFFNPVTPEQAEHAVQPYFPGDLQYIFIILHHSQYWFQCDVNKTIHSC